MAILIFAIVLGCLILIHECGHFFFARRFGVRIERFSIGFGPVVARIRGRETEYCISLIPLGGYVKLAGETADEERTGERWEFLSRPIGERIWIILAGPLANYLLAFVVFWAIFVMGSPSLTNQIGQVLEGYPAKEAGLAVGDRVLSVEGEKVEYWDEISQRIRKSTGESLKLVVDRQGEQLEITLQPRIEERQNILTQKVKIPLIGIAPKEEVISVRYPFWQAMAKAAEKLFLFTQLTFQALWLMITGALPFKESVTGPIGIFYIATGAAKMGLVYLLQIIGTISASLAIFNVLPIPVLDGGHLFFLAIEALAGKPLSQRTQTVLTQCGMALLIGVMVFVFYNDLVRFGVVERVFNR